MTDITRICIPTPYPVGGFLKVEMGDRLTVEKRHDIVPGDIAVWWTEDGVELRSHVYGGNLDLLVGVVVEVTSTAPYCR